MSDDFFTISQLNKFIKDVITSGFPQTIWVCGEIQGYDRNKSRSHVFFELVEKDPESKDIIAKIGLVIFAGKKSQIEVTLRKSENAFSLKDDIEVKFACKVDFYAPHGIVRLIVDEIDPVHTLGKLAQEKQKLIAELKNKGVFDKNKELEIPRVPMNIGLITAFDSAAYNDFIAELTKSGLGFKIFLRDCLVQGKNAESDIVKALDEIEKIDDLDLVVITRGGGSIADLSCFDSKLIAEKIAALRLPVVSGIGHEINISITDLVANTYAKTPTAVAQFLVNRVEEFLGEISEKLKLIVDLAQDRIRSEKQRLKDQAFCLQSFTMRFLKVHNEEIVRFSELLKYRPVSFLKDNLNRLDQKNIDMLEKAKLRINKEKDRLKSYCKIIEIVSPKNTLKRGFSITRCSNGKIIKSVLGLSNNDKLITEVSDGIIESKVDKII
ncbi:MAG: exodeoxyribonuclease VII large subunit [Candidatus Omnitrophica bacterium]|nr:exodeoxyribonuclease VII large subunit [Candidatus Omnitrophota bacterium]MBU1996059.1 exodeoxyribonuclease VII large subunit [Candidatus Omnitrophota bacterium]